MESQINVKSKKVKLPSNNKLIYKNDENLQLFSIVA